MSKHLPKLRTTPVYRQYLHWLRLRIALCAVVLVALGNPFACIIHCLVHVHPIAANAASPVDHMKMDHAHMHHTMAQHMAMMMAQMGEQHQPASESSSQLDCLSHHETPSPLTIAVFLPLLVVVMIRLPLQPLQINRLFLRIVDYTPPRQPPRSPGLACCVA